MRRCSITDRREHFSVGVAARSPRPGEVGAHRVSVAETDPPGASDAEDGHPASWVTTCATT